MLGRLGWMGNEAPEEVARFPICFVDGGFRPYWGPWLVGGSSLDTGSFQSISLPRIRHIRERVGGHCRQ